MTPSRAEGAEDLWPEVSPTRHCPWWERDDPYWDDALFHRPPQMRFHGTYERLVEPDRLGRRRRIRVPAYSTDPATLRSLRRSTVTRRIVAAIANWHHLTSRQIAAFVSYPRPNLSRYLKPLFETGMLLRGDLSSGMLRGGRAPYVYALNVDQPLRDWHAALSPTEQIAVTAGQTLRPHQHPIHNLLAAELALRLAEVHTDSQAVFPELLCTPQRLGLLPVSHPATWRGDLGWVRHDGLRVIIEVVQTSTRQTLAPKFEHWARALGQAHWNTTGTVVVFLNTARDRHRDAWSVLRKAHTTTINPETLTGRHGQPAAQFLQRARAQILLADWEGWFPAPWQISTAFARLTAHYTADGTTWNPVDLADDSQLPFTPTDPKRWHAPTATRTQLYCVPRWYGALPLTTPPDPGDGHGRHRRRADEIAGQAARTIGDNLAPAPGQ